MTISLYEQIGGEAGLRKFVKRFYQVMDTHPDVVEIRRMHPPNLETSEEKLFMFLSGWMGGPPQYIQKHGHPMLRRRHFPFQIGISERDQWMICMGQALKDSDLSEPTQQKLFESFYSIADHMRNQPT